MAAVRWTLPDSGVGFIGRRYACVVALGAVKTIDFTFASAAPLPYELMEAVSGSVTYDVSSEPPATIEWE